MSKRTAGLVVAATAGIACAALVATAAFADTPTPAPSATPSASSSHAPRTLAQIQAAGAKATSAREAKLTSAITTITADKYLTSSDRSTILGTLDADLAAMKASASTIAADSTATQAASDVKEVFTKYRVYAVALPQARLVSQADRLTGATLPRLTAAESKLSGLVSGKDAAKSTPALQSELNDLRAQLATASKDASDAASAALAVTPADYDANHSSFSSVKTSFESARVAVRKARSDVKAIRHALK